MNRPLKTCADYTDADRHNDYLRHKARGQTPCQPSKLAWRRRQRGVRQRLAGRSTTGGND